MEGLTRAHSYKEEKIFANLYVIKDLGPKYIRNSSFSYTLQRYTLGQWTYEKLLKIIVS